MAVEKIDQLGEWEDCGIACKDDREGCDCDKERLNALVAQVYGA